MVVGHYGVLQTSGEYFCAIAKTKALSSFAVTALICVFVFVYTKSRFSHDTAQIKTEETTHREWLNS